jgi:DNA-binding transcriptional ArsR family regulator
MKVPSVSRHLKILEEANLIQRAIEGRHHRCRLNPSGIGEVRAWIERYERFWSGQLDSLHRFVEDNPKQSPG